MARSPVHPWRDTGRGAGRAGHERCSPNYAGCPLEAGATLLGGKASNVVYCPPVFEEAAWVAIGFASGLNLSRKAVTLFGPPRHYYTAVTGRLDKVRSKKGAMNAYS